METGTVGKRNAGRDGGRGEAEARHNGTIWCTLGYREDQYLMYYLTYYLMQYFC